MCSKPTYDIASGVTRRDTGALQAEDQSHRTGPPIPILFSIFDPDAKEDFEMPSCGGNLIPGIGRKVGQVIRNGNVAAVAGGSRALCPPRDLDIGVPQP
jgi:hypothetical protein